jgi:putative peptide zinc metalloprotease protein
VEPLPRRRAVFFSVYAFLAGAYTYSVLLFLSRVTYRVVKNFNADWAFLPAVVVALMVFRGRIEKFVEFLKAMVEHYKEWIVTNRRALYAAGAALVVFLFLPLWKEVVRAPVILEPKARAMLSANVGGRVEEVMVEDGDRVVATAEVAALRAIDVEAEKSNAESQLRLANAAATAATLQYANYATAEAERRQWAERDRLTRDKARRLTIRAPFAGVVVAPGIRNLRGAFLTEGSPIAEVHDTSSMRARIYVDESDMNSLARISDESIKLDARVDALRGNIESISPTPVDPDPGLIDPSKFKGLKPPPHYVVSVLIANDGSLRSGMSGQAKLFGARRSVMGMIWRPIADFAGRKIW